MKKFKIIDCWISMALILFFIILNIIQNNGGINYILTGYFVVGGWQVISMIVHAVTGIFTHPGSTRYVYHWVTFFSLITMPIGSFWILAFTAPFMAFFYTGLCFTEVRKINQRPLAILK